MADPIAEGVAGRVAWVFPGQGSQKVGMGRDLAGADPAAAEVFALADRTLGFDLSRIVFDGPDDALQATPVQQPAIVATSLAYLAVFIVFVELGNKGVVKPVVAGWMPIIIFGSLGIAVFDSLRT